MYNNTLTVKKILNIQWIILLLTVVYPKMPHVSTAIRNYS